MENINVRISKSYKEVLTFLSLLSPTELKKIPNEKLELYVKYMDNSYDYKIDKNKPIKNQNMMDETKAILSNLFRDYFANDYQKQRILAKEINDLQKIEKIKKEKYDPYKLLEERNKSKVLTKKIVVYKHNYLIDILNKIKKIFKNKK